MGRIALGAGHADISQTRSSSFPTRVKDVLARAAATSGDLTTLLRNFISFIIIGMVYPQIVSTDLDDFNLQNGISADCLYGFERFILQSDHRCMHGEVRHPLLRYDML